MKSSDLLIRDGDYDSAVSRAYYAMFYVAQALRLSQGLSFSSHKAVIGSFGKHFVKTGKVRPELHQSLVDIFEKRQLGDYESRVSTDQAAAREALKKSRKFFGGDFKNIEMTCSRQPDSWTTTVFYLEPKERGIEILYGGYRVSFLKLNM